MQWPGVCYGLCRDQWPNRQFVSARAERRASYVPKPNIILGLELTYPSLIPCPKPYVAVFRRSAYRCHHCRKNPSPQCKVQCLTTDAGFEASVLTREFYGFRSWPLPILSHLMKWRWYQKRLDEWMFMENSSLSCAWVNCLKVTRPGSVRLDLAFLRLAMVYLNEVMASKWLKKSLFLHVPCTCVSLSQNHDPWRFDSRWRGPVWFFIY